METDSRYISSKILTNVFLKNKNLKEEFSIMTKRISLKKDIQFVKALVYGVIRIKKTIDDQIIYYYKGNYKKLKEECKNFLRIGIYQISMMDKVPNYASVNSTVEVSKKVNYKFSKTVNAILIKYIKDKKRLDFKNYDYNYNSVIIRDWKTNYSQKQVELLCKWNHSIPTIWFYINSDILKNVKEYGNFNFSIHPKVSNYVSFENPKEAIDKLVKKGLTYVQSPSSGLVVKLLNVIPGESILDACAAPGLKSRQIYESVNGECDLSMNDLKKGKYKKLLLDFKDYDVTITSKDASVDKYAFYDKILLDVPCSSTGTIQKNPDIKWKDINYMNLNKVQLSILMNMSNYIKKDGIIVYSTCSLNENENWKIISRFLTLNKNFCIDHASNYIDSTYVDKNGCMSTFPPLHQMEGMFAARLIKK